MCGEKVIIKRVKIGLSILFLGCWTGFGLPVCAKKRSLHASSLRNVTVVFVTRKGCYVTAKLQAPVFP